MIARKVYFRLLIAILIYSSRILNMLPFGGAAVLFLSYILLFIWTIAPLLFKKTNTLVAPFPDDSSAQRLLTLFITWQMVVFFRGLFFNYTLPFGPIEQLGNPYGIFAFLLPLVVFLNSKQFNFRQLVTILSITGVIFVLYVFFNRAFLFSADHYSIGNQEFITDDSIEDQASWSSAVMFSSKLFMMMGFLMLLPGYIEKKLYFFVIICWGLAFFCAAMGGRRGTCVTLILMALASMYFYVNRKKQASNVFKYLLLIFAIVGIAYYVYSSYTDMFSIMADRIDADSRSEVVVGFWTDMGSGLDWIWGRGLNGEYHCLFNQNGEFVSYRNAIENGYLHIILSGGVILLLLYIGVLTKAVIKGFFHSNNQLTKAFAAYIAISLFNLIPFGLPECSVTFFIVWVGVAICGSSYYRSMSDKEVMYLFK